MGYTHYYKTNRSAFGKLDQNNQPESNDFWNLWDKYQQVVYNICQKAEERGIKLGNCMGEYYPTINAFMISLTGSTKQPANKWVRHPNNSQENNSFLEKLAEQFGGNVIANGNLQWPSSIDIVTKNTKGKVDGERFAGIEVNIPSVGNPDGKPFVDASYEPFYLTSKVEENSWRENTGVDKRVFNCTKTNYMPYDTVVTACLIALKVMFQDKVKVASDGGMKDRALGYMLLNEANPTEEYDWKSFKL